MLLCLLDPPPLYSMDATSPCLTAHRLSLQTDARTLVDALDLTLEPGEVLGILGANGAGKSTLLTVLAGQANPAHGHVMLDNQRLDTLPPLTRAPAHRPVAAG